MLDPIPDHEPQRLSWEELLKRSQGDPQAFGDFVEATQAWVWKLCLSLVQHTQDAEDLMQDVFTLAFRFRGTYDGRPVAPWLSTIAKNHSVSLYRQRAGKPDTNSVSLGDCADEVLGAGASEHLARTACDGVEHSEIVSLLLEVLSAPEYEVVTLHFWKELGPTEISVLLEIPLGTVSTHKSRALKKMARRHHELFPD